jgi:uncharacterized protein YbjT (DUF2867 family)
MSSKVLVIGGTGMLGLPVARKLKEDGFEVTIMTTDTERAGQKLGGEFGLVQGDVTVPESLAAPMEAADIVYLNLNSKHDPRLYEEIEIRGTMNCAWTARRKNVKRICLISGASSEGKEKGVIYLDAKVKAETALIESGVPFTIMRPSWFFESLPVFVRGDRAGVIGKQPIPRGWLAAEDYARQVSRAFQTEEAANMCFYNLGPQKMTILKAVERFCARHYPNIKPTTVSYTMAHMLALMPGQEKLKAAIPFFKYFEGQPENGLSDEADRILGPNLTTLEEWLERYRPPAN